MCQRDSGGFGCLARNWDGLTLFRGSPSCNFNNYYSVIRTLNNEILISNFIK
jgi:hypothetical protein